MTEPIRVLIVDDHAVMCAGLRMLIEKQPSFKVVGEALHRDAALALTSQTQPDVIVLDLMLEGDNSLDFMPQLLQATEHRTRILILTGVRDPDVHRQALQLGAMGIVMKEQAPDVLIRAIEKVLVGEFWIERAVMSGVLGATLKATGTEPQNPEATKIASLTEREREVIALICEGLRNQKIAERLFITPATVRNHLNSIYSKLEVSDRLALSIYAHQHNLTKG